MTFLTDAAWLPEDGGGLVPGDDVAVRAGQVQQVVARVGRLEVVPVNVPKYSLS